MNSLLDVIKEPARRQALISDVVTLINSQVTKQRGASGFAIKAGYGVVSKLRNGEMIPTAVSALLDDFAKAIEPLHAEYRSSSTSNFASFMDSNKKRASEALLSITDERIAGASSVVNKTYRRLRPMAEKQVANAARDIGAVIDRHTSA